MHRAATNAGRRISIARPLAACAALGLVAACTAGTPSGAPGPRPTAAAPIAATLPADAPPPTALPTLAPPSVDLGDVPSRLHLDGSAGDAAWIGPDGGTLDAVAGDGTRYALDIPAGALEERTPISMTPIGSIDDLGLAGGAAGSVFLQPTGTRLALPALLHIVPTRTAPAGMQLVGFDVADDGQVDIVPALAGESDLTALVFHFSAPGVGWGTTDDLRRLAPPITSPLTADMRLSSNLTALYAEPVPWDSVTTIAAYTLANFEWLGLIRDELANAQDDLELVHALADWNQLVFLINLLSAHGDVRQALADGPVPVAQPFPAGIVITMRLIATQGLAQVANRILHAIDGNMDLCKRSHDLGALANLSYWAAAGARYAPQGDNSIYTSRAQGCAAPAIGTFDPASNLRAGLVDSLGIAFVLRFSDGTRIPADFQSTLTGVGFTFVSTGSAQASAGEMASVGMTFDVSGSADPPYELRANVCWSLDGLPRGLCGLLRQGFGGPVGTVDPRGQLDWTTPCIDLEYQGTWINLDTPAHVEIPGVAQVVTPCHGLPLLLNALATSGGGDITQERIAYRIDGGSAGFTATEFACEAGLPDNGCTGNTTVMGGGGQALTLTISATKSGEALWSFSGSLSGTFPVQ